MALTVDGISAVSLLILLLLLYTFVYRGVSCNTFLSNWTLLGNLDGDANQVMHIASDGLVADYWKLVDGKELFIIVA